MHELLSVYAKYSKIKNLTSELLDSTEGHVSVKFKGDGVWAAFQHETGKHAVQRYSGKEKHTSLVSVAVLPLPPEHSLDALPASEIEITAQRGHGPGGQNVNKVASAIRAVHTPTGTTVFINGRDQHRNKQEALKILTARVNIQKNNEKFGAYNTLRKSLSDAGRGSKVRTYNFIKSRVVDHRSGKKTANVKAIFDGQLDLVL